MNLPRKRDILRIISSVDQLRYKVGKRKVENDQLCACAVSRWNSAVDG